MECTFRTWMLPRNANCRGDNSVDGKDFFRAFCSQDSHSRRRKWCSAAWIPTKWLNAGGRQLAVSGRQRRGQQFKWHHQLEHQKGWDRPRETRPQSWEFASWNTVSVLTKRFQTKTEPKHSRGAKRCSAGQAIPDLLRNLKVHGACSDQDEIISNILKFLDDIWMGSGRGGLRWERWNICRCQVLLSSSVNAGHFGCRPWWERERCQQTLRMT